ncbi:hypothetical protein GE09DRAFT_1291259 [Coniochaeta sp. 2T2.1]|nr:hypothetical protein GE09DRAFT_1291259 [Coniochaeta sp. 2T2.1]
MVPPPATPASSSKFLLSKRQQTQSQQQVTPSQPSAGPRRFNVTPRFAVTSTQKTPSSQAHFATPAILPPRSSSRRNATQDLIDIESSPEPSAPDSSSGREARDVLGDDDLITSFVSEPANEEQQGGRSPKRRRISISPVLESSPPLATRSDTLPDRLDIEIEPSVPSSQGDGYDRNEDEKKEEGDFRNSSDIDSDEGQDDEDQAESSLRPASPPRFLYPAEMHIKAQQVFKAPPQFKLPSGTTSLQPQYPLPDAFSPQRRGAKYVNGGLAGELRDWLVDVKGLSEAADASAATGSKPGGETEFTSAVTVSVEEVNQGTGFRLVRGTNGQGGPVHMVLAGEGRFFGLVERRNAATIGCTVMILPPTWNIELDGQGWTVACDWYVQHPQG